MLGDGPALGAAAAAAGRVKAARTPFNGFLEDFGDLPGEIVEHGLAVLARRRAAGGLADLGVHGFEPGGEVGGVWPLGDDGVERRPVPAILRKRTGGPVVGGGDRAVGIKGSIELGSKIGKAAARAHLGEDGFQPAGIVAGGIVDAGHDGGGGCVLEALQGLECQSARKKDPLSACKRDPFRCGLCEAVLFLCSADGGRFFVPA